MHRPPATRKIGLAIAMMMAFAPNAARFEDIRREHRIHRQAIKSKRSGNTTPHQGEREMLRRRVGGFAQLHNHPQQPCRLGGDCLICDLKMSHKEAAAAQEKASV